MRRARSAYWLADSEKETYAVVDGSQRARGVARALVIDSAVEDDDAAPHRKQLLVELLRGGRGAAPAARVRQMRSRHEARASRGLGQVDERGEDRKMVSGQRATHKGETCIAMRTGAGRGLRAGGAGIKQVRGVHVLRLVRGTRQRDDHAVPERNRPPTQASAHHSTSHARA